jgi:hypothetical protein
MQLGDELELLAEMKPSSLIQRLEKPLGFDNPFSFGGGYRNGGVSSEGMAVLRDIFSFEYMGAAEFEFGAVPAALEFIRVQGTNGNLITGEHRNVYYIAPIPYEEGVRRIIEQLLEDERQLRFLREPTLLARSFENPDEMWRRTVGWLELDNGFFLFIDQEMFEKTKHLFGAG